MDEQPPDLDMVIARLKQKHISPKLLKEFSEALKKYPKIHLHRPPAQGPQHREFVPRPSRCAGYIEKLLTPGYVATMPGSEMDEWLDLAGRTGMREISDRLAIPRAAIHLTVVNQMLWPTDIRYNDAFCTTIPTYILKIHEKIDFISHEALEVLVQEVYSDKKWRRAHWPPHSAMEVTPGSLELHFTGEVQDLVMYGVIRGQTTMGYLNTSQGPDRTTARGASGVQPAGPSSSNARSGLSMDVTECAEEDLVVEKPAEGRNFVLPDQVGLQIQKWRSEGFDLKTIAERVKVKGTQRHVSRTYIKAVLKKQN